MGVSPAAGASATERRYIYRRFAIQLRWRHPARASGLAVDDVLLSGVVGVSYSQQFDLSPYSGPITFTPPSGTLPPGLSLTSVGGDVGLLSGTPTTPGSYTFTLRATNSYGTADKSFTIVISTAAAAGSSWAWVA